MKVNETKINARLVVERENRLFVVFRRSECFFLFLLAEHFGQVLKKIDGRLGDRHIEQMVTSNRDQPFLIVVILLMARLEQQHSHQPHTQHSLSNRPVSFDKRWTKAKELPRVDR